MQPSEMDMDENLFRGYLMFNVFFLVLGFVMVGLKMGLEWFPNVSIE